MCVCIIIYVCIDFCSSSWMISAVDVRDKYVLTVSWIWRIWNSKVFTVFLKNKESASMSTVLSYRNFPNVVQKWLTDLKRSSGMELGFWSINITVQFPMWYTECYYLKSQTFCVWLSCSWFVQTDEDSSCLS